MEYSFGTSAGNDKCPFEELKLQIQKTDSQAAFLTADTSRSDTSDTCSEHLQNDFLEVWGIEPQTSRMQSERSTPELYPQLIQPTRVYPLVPMNLVKRIQTTLTFVDDAFVSSLSAYILLLEDDTSSKEGCACSEREEDLTRKPSEQISRSFFT